MTAVIYARYSSDNQREESIEGQIRECTAYAEKNGITIVKHYIDRAISAKTDKNQRNIQIVYLRYAIQRCSCCIKKLNFYGLWRNKELCQNDTIAPGTVIEPLNVNILLS